MRRNTGFVTEAQGTGTVANGNAAVTFNHGCGEQPALSRVVITPTNATAAAAQLYVSAVSATQVTVTAAIGNVGADATFGWRVEA